MSGSGLLEQLPLSAVRQAELHLATLAVCAARESWLELRWRAGAGMGQAFHPVGEYRLAARRAVELGKTTDVYAGVAVRSEQGGDKRAVRAVRILWADCDSPQAVDRLEEFSPAPQMVVQSSPGRLHAYWPLRETVAPDAAESAMRRLAAHLGADSACAEAARILRIPGTYSHKRGGERVRLVRFEPAPSPSLAEVVEALPPDPKGEPPPRAVPPRERAGGTDADLLRTIPALEYVPALTGRGVTRQGYVRCPFHGNGEERTPSLHVRGRDEYAWFCHACRFGGGIFDLAGRVLGLDPRRDFPEVVRRTADVLVAGVAA